MRVAAAVGVLAGALAVATPAEAGTLLTPDSPSVLVREGELVSGSRVDGAVRFDPLAPGIRLAAEDESEGSEEADYSYTVSLGGDVSGDELDDVLQVSLGYDDDGRPLRSLLTARRGDTGDSLWQTSFGPGVSWGGYLPGDLTGDDHPDLAFTTLEDVTVVVLYPPPGLACFDCLKYVLTATTRLLVVDGGSGEQRWQEARPVTFTFFEQPLPQTGTLLRAWVASHLLAALQFSDDLDEDGGRDLLWAPWEGAYTDVKNEQAATVGAYAGADGESLWTLPLAGGGATPWNASQEALSGAWAGPDASGDGTPDVYTSEIEETPAQTVLVRKAIDGRSGEQLWRRERAWASDARLLRGGYVPLAGGRLVYALTANGLRSDIEALDPRTGQVRWQQLAADAAIALPAGDVSGDGAGDLLYLSAHADGSVALTAVDGEDGTGISRRTFASQEWRWLFLMTPLLDHSGDARADAILGGGRVTTAGIEETWSLTELASGEELWGSTRAGAETPTYLLPASDFDQQQGAEVLLARIHDRLDDPQPRIELAGLRGPTGRPLWNQEAYRVGPPGETIWQVGLDFLADSDGGRGEDFLVNSVNLWSYFQGGGLDNQTDLVDGRKGRPYLRLAGSGE